MTLDGQEAEDFARAVVDSLEQLAPEILDRLNLDLERMLAEHRQIRRGFERRLDDVWGRALDRYWATYVACTEAGVLCNEAAKPGAAEENDIRFLALTRLHGRACMVASEIHALLRTGHAAGAEARWRTLHEIAVVSAVIVEADQDVAERYLLHASIDSARDLHDYERVRERLGLEAIDPIDVERIETAKAELLERYGRPYGGDWGWAITIIGHDRVTFRELEDVSGFDHLRPYYQRGSHRIHASARGLELGAAEFRGTDQMLVGPSNAGLSEVGHGALIALANATISLLRARITDDTMFLPTMKVLIRMSDIAGESFAEAEANLRQLEKEYLDAAAHGRLAFRLLQLQRWGKRWRRKIERNSSRLRRVGRRISQSTREVQAPRSTDPLD